MTSNNSHRWLVLAASFSVMFISYGNDHGMAVFFPALLDTFKRSRSLTASVHAIFRGLSGSFGIFSGLITAKIGIARTSFIGGVMLSVGFISSYFANSVETLCVTIGVLGGIGKSMMTNAATTAIALSFSGTKRRFAVGVQNVGINLGGIAMSLLIDMLLFQYGLRGTFLVTGGVPLNTLAASIIFSFDNSQHTLNKPDDNLKNSSRDACSDVSDQSTKNKFCLLQWVSKPVMLVIIGIGACLPSVKSLNAFIVDLFLWRGASQDNGVTCITVINSSALVSRTLLAVSMRLCNTFPLAQMMVMCLLGTAGVSILAITEKPEVMWIGGALLGIQFGTMTLSSSVFIMDNVPPAYISIAMGVLDTSIGVMAVSTGPIYGALYDWTSSYQTVLLVVGCLNIFSCILFLVAMLIHKYNKKKRKTKEEENPTVPVKDPAYNKILPGPVV